MGKLIGKEFSPSVKQVVPYEKKEREPLVLPEKADNMKRAYWYLVSVRGISPKIVSHFMNRKMLYQEKKYGNCVFVGYDAEEICIRDRAIPTFPGTGWRFYWMP